MPEGGYLKRGADAVSSLASIILPSKQSDVDQLAMAEHLRTKYGIKGAEAATMAKSLSAGQYPEAVQMRAEIAASMPAPKSPTRDEEFDRKNSRAHAAISEGERFRRRNAEEAQGYLRARDPEPDPREFSLNGESSMSTAKPEMWGPQVKGGYLGEPVSADGSRLQSMLKKKV